METQTIKDLRNWILESEKTLKLFKPNNYKGQTFGQESEYTPDMLKMGMRALLNDIRGLVRAPKKFVRISTYEERQQILHLLQRIQQRMINQEFDNAASSMDKLKVAIRTYHMRGSSESKAALADRMSELNAISSNLEDNLSQSEDILSRAKNLQEQYDQFFNTLTELTEKIPQIADLQEQSTNQQQKIHELLEWANAHQGDLKDFIEQIEARNNQFTDQKQRTEEYAAKLEEYTAEHNQAKKQAADLLGEAKSALEFSTIAGISSAFNERYIEEKNRRRVNFGWLVGASVFILGAIGIGIFFLLYEDQISLGDSIVRIAIMSTAIGAAWFCATRYARYNDIMEDYGYKSVLAKTILAFHDYFEGDDREGYLQSFMKEMLQDPLRKRHDVEHPAASILQRITRSKKDDEGDQ